MLGLRGLPVSLLTPYAVLHPNGSMSLGTINQAIQKRFDCPEFQAYFQDFIQVVPNAMTELTHWQQEGYALIKPEIFVKQTPTEKIR